MEVFLSGNKAGYHYYIICKQGNTKYYITIVIIIGSGIGWRQLRRKMLPLAKNYIAGNKGKKYYIYRLVCKVYIYVYKVVIAKLLIQLFLVFFQRSQQKKIYIKEYRLLLLFLYHHDDDEITLHNVSFDFVSSCVSYPIFVKLLLIYVDVYTFMAAVLAWRHQNAGKKTKE